MTVTFYLQMICWVFLKANKQSLKGISELLDCLQLTIGLVWTKRGKNPRFFS